MKLPHATPPAATPRARRRGSAVIVLLALLAVMLILVAANGKTLLHLHKELKLLERQQLHRLNTAQTNATVVAPLVGDPAANKL